MVDLIEIEVAQEQDKDLSITERLLRLFKAMDEVQQKQECESNENLS